MVSEARSSGERKRRKGPAPVEAGTNLLVHDLKNIAGRLALLVRNMAERYEDPLFKDSAVGLLDDTVGYLKRLAADLRKREGRMIVKMLVRPDEILEEAVADHRLDVPHGVRLVAEIGETPAIWGDAYLLRRAFSCAMENALEALEGRGRLDVRCGTELRSGRLRAVVLIEDDGPGMTPEFVSRLLSRPFTTTKADGLGLGLYTIRQVATLHGGRVRITTAPDSGTTLRFSFPADAESPT